MVCLRAYMVSCQARDAVRSRTPANLSATDWRGELIVELDDSTLTSPVERHLALVRRILRRAAAGDESFLLLEDNLSFNRYLFQNLEAWYPLRQLAQGEHFFASLYNSGLQFVGFFPELAYGEASPGSVRGSQAFLISPATARYMVTCWGVERSPHADLRLARLAARVTPLLYHVPSLVQHEGTESTWRGPFSRSVDFDENWRSTGIEIDQLAVVQPLTFKRSTVFLPQSHSTETP
jgi:hypothetical protein